MTLLRLSSVNGWRGLVPRGRVKAILHTARFAEASSRGRRPECRADRQHHPIPPGAWYLAIKDGMNEKKYCLECARAILERGREQLNELFQCLEGLEA